MPSATIVAPVGRQQEGLEQDRLFTPTTLSQIGNTPMVRLTAFDTGPCALYLKLESQNPGGSIKDRMALAMVETAERSGALKPGQILVEATAGNTGIGLALVAAIKGYRLILVIPDKMSVEKIAHARALGAEIRLTRSDVEPGHPDYYQDLAARIARETPDSYHINQFGNPANPAAHEPGCSRISRWCSRIPKARRCTNTSRPAATSRRGATLSKESAEAVCRKSLIFRGCGPLTPFRMPKASGPRASC
jgi:hypothetical protein